MLSGSIGKIDFVLELETGEDAIRICLLRVHFTALNQGLLIICQQRGAVIGFSPFRTAQLNSVRFAMLVSHFLSALS